MTLDAPQPGAGPVGEIAVECVRPGAPRSPLPRDLSTLEAAKVVGVVAELGPRDVWPVSVSDAVRAVCVLIAKAELR